jgi:molecular chaperone GrpE
MTGPQSDAVKHGSEMPCNGHKGPDLALTPEEARLVDSGRIADLEAELAETRDRWMRAEAENANVRSRARRDVDEAKQFAMQRFATEVVAAADNLHRGLESVPLIDATEPGLMTRLRAGFAEVERSFVDMLARNGIKRVDPTGTAFDAASHQAMGAQHSQVHAPGTVLQTLSPAWTLNGRLLRPAMVLVAKQH